MTEKGDPCTGTASFALLVATYLCLNTTLNLLNKVFITFFLHEKHLGQLEYLEAWISGGSPTESDANPTFSLNL